MRYPIALATSLVLAAPALAAPPVQLNAFNDRMLKLSPADQAGALRRAITTDNQRCGQVSAVKYRGRYGNLGSWQASCKPGGDYAVFLGPDESAQVRKCGDMATLKLPACIAVK